LRSGVEAFNTCVFGVIKNCASVIDFMTEEVVEVVIIFAFGTVRVGVKSAPRIDSKGREDAFFILEKVSGDACDALARRIVVGVTQE
jgi:hypothetical protein